MKNLIIALAMFFALGVNAQAKKTAVKATRKAPAKEVAIAAAPKLTDEEKANKNLADLNAAVTLTPERQADFLRLFNTKYKMLNGSGQLSEDRKEVIYNTIERKLEGSLDGPSFEKIKANPALLKSLTH